MNYQRIVVAGNLPKDALYKKSQKSDKEYTLFSVAVKSYKKEKPTYFPVIFFGERAKSLTQYLIKGRAVLVEGRIETDEKYRFTVIADNIVLGIEHSH